MFDNLLKVKPMNETTSPSQDYDIELYYMTRDLMRQITLSMVESILKETYISPFTGKET